MHRRQALKFTLLAGSGLGAGLLAGRVQAQPACPGEGTPLQFIPKQPADPQASVNDIGKYPKCPYCGMDRRQFHHSRMLVHYSDDLADGVCSLHCAAISLSLNIDRDPQALWVGDNAAPDDIKPLVDVDQAVFLVGSRIPGVMTARSKVAFGSAEAAQAAQARQGGELLRFDQALLAAYADMSADVARIRRMRALRRQKMLEQQK